MGVSIAERFFQVLENETERLKQEEGNKINPTGKKEPFGGWELLFKDNCDYVYSLHNLDAACYALTSFIESLSKRSEQDKNRSNYLQDLQRSMDVHSKIAFYLRGYVGAFSEESMVLEEDRLQELQDILMSWIASSGNSGKARDKLYQFLWDYASVQLLDDIEENDEYSSVRGKSDDIIKWRVNREIKVFKEILDISRTIVSDAFNNVWYGYENDFKAQQEEKISQQEYIDRIINEKLQSMKQELQKIGLLVSSMQGAGQTQGELNSRVGSCIKDLYERINSLQGQSVQQSNSNGWYKCPAIKSFGRPCKGKVKHGEYCEECSTYFP